jgi:hypothetical protein
MGFSDGIPLLMPAYALLLGALIALIVGPVVTARHRHWLIVGISTVALLTLAWAGISNYAIALSPSPLHAIPLHILSEWLGEPVIALRTLFEPVIWALSLSLLAIVLAGQEFADRVPAVSYALLFVLWAAACGVVLAGTYRTLALVLILFDGSAALFLLAHQQFDRAVGRLLLGILSSAAVVAASLSHDLLRSDGIYYTDVFFSLAAWLRLGLYPLVETSVTPGSAPPARQAWHAANLGIGLYLVSMGITPWIAWPALVTTLLHSVLAWIEPRRERALFHAAYALAGNVLVMSALGATGISLQIASLNVLVSWLALALTQPRLGPPMRQSRSLALQRIGAYLPPGLATISLVGLPLTLGWQGRTALFQVVWDAGGPGALGLVVLAEGSALSVLFRYWRVLLRDVPSNPKGIEACQISAWRQLGATVAVVPFLVPVLGLRFATLTAAGAPDLTSLASYGPGVWIGLTGSLLWALFLGYGHRWLPASETPSHKRSVEWLHLTWLLPGVEFTAQTLGRGLLRVRAVIEGEHYLAWAILLAICLGMLLLFYPASMGH